MSRRKMIWWIAVVVVATAMAVWGYYHDMRVRSLRARYAEIKTLATGLKLYHLDQGVYPEDLRALVGVAKEAPDLTDGGNFVYEVSEDGQRAFLDGKDIEAIFNDD